MQQSTVWKYTLKPDSNDWMELEMPIGAEILTAGAQGESIVMWAKVNPKADLETRKFCVVGTGFMLPPGQSKYVGTAKLYNDRLIIHVFEKAE